MLVDRHPCRPCPRFAYAIVLALLALASCRIAKAKDRLLPAQWPPLRPLNEAALKERGLRIVRGEHLTLITDIAPQTAVDELPAVVDAGIQEWIRYFGLKPELADNWKAQACLIKDPLPFTAAGLMPRDGHTFPHALSLGYEIWVNEQPSDYYRRHLLLHEVTHSFMSTLIGSCGPGWYMEGTAELLGTHRWDRSTGSLKLGVIPANKNESPYWGRIALLKSHVGTSGPLAVPAVMKIDNTKALSVASYSWVWGLAKFLDSHPRYQERFRKLPRLVLRRDFDRRFRRAYKRDWDQLTTEWQWFAHSVEYGYDIEREAIDFSSSKSLDLNKSRVKIAADRGWQSTGIALDQGDAIELTAEGQYTIGFVDKQPIRAEAGGVTLRYHRGQPLGRLLAAVVDTTDLAPGKATFAEPVPLSPKATLAAPRDGVLFLRINDSPAELAENAGSLLVQIKQIP